METPLDDDLLPRVQPVPAVLPRPTRLRGHIGFAFAPTCNGLVAPTIDQYHPLHDNQYRVLSARLVVLYNTMASVYLSGRVICRRQPLHSHAMITTVLQTQTLPGRVEPCDSAAGRPCGPNDHEDHPRHALGNERTDRRGRDEARRKAVASTARLSIDSSRSPSSRRSSLDYNSTPPSCVARMRGAS